MDPDELFAITVLMSRYVMAMDSKTAADEAKKAADDAAMDAYRVLANCRSAFSAFGYNTSDREFFDTLKEAMGDEAWLTAFRRARPQPPTPPADEAPQGDEQGAEDPIPTTDTPTIRDIALGRLTEAGDEGVKAAEIREFMLQTYNLTVHDKTVGMTLYRLLRAGLARREGHTWFSATPDGTETENPGGDTPGSEDGQNEEEEA